MKEKVKINKTLKGIYFEIENKGIYSEYSRFPEVGNPNKDILERPYYIRKNQK